VIGQRESNRIDAVGITDPTVLHTVFSPVTELNVCSFQGQQRLNALGLLLGQWLPIGVPRHPRVPFTMPRGAAS